MQNRSAFFQWEGLPHLNMNESKVPRCPPTCSNDVRYCPMVTNDHRQRQDATKRSISGIATRTERSDATRTRGSWPYYERSDRTLRTGLLALLLGARTLRTGLLALLLGARTLRTGLLALLLGARTLRTGLLALLLGARTLLYIIQSPTRKRSSLH